MKKAFTIIELLVAIAIIGILIGVVLVALNSAKDRARYSKALVDMQTIAAAASNYQAEKDVWPDDTNPGVMPHELRSQNFRGSLPISTTLPTPPCANMVYDWDNWCASGVPSCNDHTNVTRRVTLRFSDTYLPVGYFPIFSDVTNYGHFANGSDGIWGGPDIATIKSLSCSE